MNAWTRLAARLRSRVRWKLVGFVLSATITLVSLLALWRILHGIRIDEVVAALGRLPRGNVVAAGLFVGCAYVMQSFYDLFALRTIGKPNVPYRIAALASFTSYAIGHNVGATAFSGGAVRYRIYSSWGLGALDVAKMAFVTGLTFWLGNAAALGVAVALRPDAAGMLDHLPAAINRLIAVAALGLLGAYVAWVWRRPREWGADNWHIALPSGPLTFVQIAIGIGDLACCSLAMYLLLPPEPHIPYLTFTVIFVTATLLGFISHAPGSIGVFDASILVGLSQFDREALVAGLLLFRLIYFVLPFGLALTLVASREVFLARRNGGGPTA